MTLYEKLIAGGPQALAKYVAKMEASFFDSVAETLEVEKFSAEQYEQLVISIFRKLTKEAPND